MNYFFSWSISLVFNSSNFFVMSLISLFIKEQKSSIDFVKFLMFWSVPSSLSVSLSSFYLYFEPTIREYTLFSAEFS